MKGFTKNGGLCKKQGHYGARGFGGLLLVFAIFVAAVFLISTTTQLRESNSMKEQIVEMPRYLDGEVIELNGMAIPTVFHTYPGSRPFHLVRVDQMNLSPIQCEADFNGNTRGVSFPPEAMYKDPQNPSVVIRQSVGAFRVQNLESKVHHPHRNHHH